MRPKFAPFAPSIKERSVTALVLILMVGLFSTAGGILAYYFLRNPDLLLDAKNRKIPLATKNNIIVSSGQFIIADYLIRKVTRTPLRKVAKISLNIPVNWKQSDEPIRFRSTSDLEDWILADIEKTTNTLPLKKWLDDIYRLYIAGPAISHSSGLLHYRFKPQSPYETIELFTDNLQNPSFFIKCELQSSSLGARLCERTLVITPQIQIRYRFARLKLGDWHQIHQTIQNLVKSSFRSNTQ